jgi:hypothetical protein
MLTEVAREQQKWNIKSYLHNETDTQYCKTILL